MLNKKKGGSDMNNINTMKTSELYKTDTTKYTTGDIAFDKYKHNNYSQNGEDGVLSEIINRLETCDKFFVEFGGWDGTYLSNTANLRINNDWDGVLFEGDSNKIPNPESMIKIYNEFITSVNIIHVFKKYKIPNNFGLLSIDIDGDDPYVFQALDTNKYKPDIIICEYNPGLPNHIPIKYHEQLENQSVYNVERGYFGANLNCFYNIAKTKGYEFVTTVNWNVIFIRCEIFNKLNIELKDKNHIMETNTIQYGHSFWKNLILQHELDWIIT